MDDQSLRNVLALLRKVQGSDPTTTALAFINSLAGKRVNDAALARISAYIIDQADQGLEVIDNSQLIEEAKTGVRNALKSVSKTFAIGNLHGNIKTLHSQAAGYVSNLVILLSASGISLETDIPDDARDLASEIDQFANAFDDDLLDPVVREIAKKHMAVLATLIRHIPIFGLEPALQSYFELMLKLRRADGKSSNDAKGRLDGAMDTFKKWGERLKSLDDVINTGSNLLTRGQSLTPLLQYIPGIS